MEIEGPLTISVQEDDATMKRELHLAFKPAFINKKLFERIEQFQSYMDHLSHNIHKLHKDEPDRLGMETILEICQNLAEFIASDELDLEETIVIELQPNINITNLLTSGSVN
jgi:hypothetical protein